MKIKLVFDRWNRGDTNIYAEADPSIRNDLVTSDLHGGSTFDAEIELDIDAEMDLAWAFANGASARFIALPFKN